MRHFQNLQKRVIQLKKKAFNQFDDIWFVDRAGMIQYKVSISEGYRYIFVLIDKFWNYAWCTPLKNKNGRSKTDEFSNKLSTSK